MTKDSAIETKQEKAKAKTKDKKSGPFSKIVRYFKDLKSEFKKIVWPSKKQIINNTLVVIVCMAVVALIIWLLDWAFISLLSLIY